MVDMLIGFQIFLFDEDLITDHDWNFEDKAIKFLYYEENRLNNDGTGTETENE